MNIIPITQDGHNYIFSSSSRPTGVNLKYSGAGKDCCLKEAKAASIAASDDLDLGG